MKGIILAGGAGSRLYPLTQVVCKQLLPVYDKPMIYYPVSLLMQAGIQEILIISTPKDTPQFQSLLGDGNELGVKFNYKIQEKPSGLPEAFVIGKDFIGNDDVMMILGDNLFYGPSDFLTQAVSFHKNKSGSKGQIFGYQVEDPTRFGVVEFDPTTMKVLSLIEKPTEPKSPFAIPGIYIFDSSVAHRAQNVRPSPRGETEIVDLMKSYLNEDALNVHIIPRGVSWFDAGTHESLLEVSNFIAAIEKRQGLKIGCLIEIAARRGFITLDQFAKSIEQIPKSPFKTYLLNVLQQIQLYPQTRS